MKAPELKELAITFLQEQHPDAYITTELSVAEWGGASVDVAAITSTEIVGIEIKGEGDSPTRLELQGLKYGRVCQRMWLLCTPDGTLGTRCHKKRPNGWGALEVKDGAVQPQIWERRWDADQEVTPVRQPHLCAAAMCETLWRDELHTLAREWGGLPGLAARPTVKSLRKAVVGGIPTTMIHDLMIKALRRRVWPPGKRIIAPTLDAGTVCGPCKGTGLWQGGDLAQKGLNVQDVTCGHCRGTGKAKSA